MAEIVQIQGSPSEGKIRNPWGVIGLSLITLGVYWWFWYYFVNKELAEMGKARGTEELGTSPGTSLLAVTLGCFIIVPPFVSLYKFWVRKRNAAQLTGAEPGLEPALGWIIQLFLSIVGTFIAQLDMNKILQAQASGAGALPPQATEAPVPAPAPESPEQPV